MDGNTVFQVPGSPESGPAQQAPPPVAPTGQAPSAPDASSARGGRFPPGLSKILKALIGIFFIALIGFLIFKFVAPRLTSQTGGSVELTYWGLWEDNATMKTVLSDFERENPTIKVAYKQQDIKKYRERLVTQVQNGTGPDIFRYHATWIPMLSSILVPLPSDVISSADLQKFYYPTVQRDLLKNGAIYGVPVGIDTLSLFINIDIFKAAGLELPKTWDDFASASRRLTVKDQQGIIKTAGAAMGTFDNISHAPDIVSLLFVQNGADLKNLSSTSQFASDALTFYNGFAKGDGKVWDDSLDPSVLAFAKGNLAMFFGYSWDIFTIKAVNANLNFEVHSVPHLPSRENTIASYWVEGASSKSKHQKEVMLLLKFLAKKETQQKIYTVASKTRLFGEPYARVDLADSLRSNPLVYPFVAQAKDASSSFFAGETYDNGLNYQVNGYLGNAVRSMLDNTSAQTAVDTLSQGVAQVLRQYSTQ